MEVKAERRWPQLKEAPAGTGTGLKYCPILHFLIVATVFNLGSHTNLVIYPDLGPASVELVWVLHIQKK